MSIDPRVMKTLLQLQWMPSVDISRAGGNVLSSQDGTASTLFQTLLDEYVQSAEADSASVGTGAQERLSSWSALPSSWMAAAGQAAATQTGKSGDYDALIEHASLKYGVDRSLITAVIHHESSFNAGVVSPAGAKGLMQLMDGTASWLGVNDAFDPAQNIDGGTRYLSYLLRKYDGNEAAALAAYNAGPGRVDRLGIHNDADVVDKLQQLPEETRNYIRKVLATRELY